MPLIQSLKKIPIVFVTVLIGTTTAFGGPQSPSQFSEPGSKPAPPVTFVLFEERDLRLLFCIPDVLEGRSKRNVCIVDNAFSGAREVAISHGETVRDLLKKLDKPWRGGSQLRLITSNSIEQTPWGLGTVDAKKAPFLDRILSSGDILVIAVKE